MLNETNHTETTTTRVNQHKPDRRKKNLTNRNHSAVLQSTELFHKLHFKLGSNSLLLLRTRTDSTSTNFTLHVKLQPQRPPRRPPLLPLPLPRSCLRLPRPP